MITIDKYGNISMKGSEMIAVREWMELHPECWELSVNEGVQMYLNEMNGVNVNAT